MLGDDIARALPELRAHAESMMTETVTISRPGAVTTDPATGQVTAAAGPVYTGRARWKAPSTAASESETGTATIVVTPGAVHIPVGTPYAPIPGDVITCTASRDNPHLIGEKVVVRSRIRGANLTAYRIPIEEV